VRLSITHIDPRRPETPGEVLLDIRGESVELRSTATAWVASHGVEQLADRIGPALDRRPPDSGYFVGVHVASGMMLLVTWPRCPEAVSRERRFPPLPRA